VGDLDVVRDLALAGGAKVAQADSLLHGELTGDADDVEPLGQLINCNERHDRAWDGVDRAINGGPVGVGPDNEVARSGDHGEITVVAMLRCGRQ